MIYRLSSLFEEDILDSVEMDLVSESGLDDIIDEFNESFADNRIHLFENTDNMPKMAKNVKDVNTDDDSDELMGDLDDDEIIDYVESEGK